MAHKPRIFLAGLSFLLFTAFFQAVSADPADPSLQTPGDAFVTVSSAEPSNLIPFLASDSASAEVSRLIFNGLLKYDKDLKLTGDLAESWEVQEGGTRILFHLRKNVRWQDGGYFTAHDVVFTYLNVMNPHWPTPYSGMFEKVESVYALDRFTVEVRYKEPFAPGLASWTMGIVPAHRLSMGDFPNTPFSTSPIGTGPYALKRWVRGELIELRANPQYFEGAPLISRLLIRILPDPATSFLELQMENLDTSSLTPLQFDRQIETDFFKKNYKSYRMDGMQYTYLGYNLQSPLFEDRRVRQALAMVIDTGEIIQGAYRGYGRPVAGPFLPDSWAYDPSVQPFAHDPVQAKKLLEDAGWKMGHDGWLVRDGRKFSFTVLTNAGNDERKMVCEILQKQFRVLGIDMKIQTVEWGAFLKEFIHTKNFEAALLGWNLAPDPDIYDIFHSSRSAPGQFNFVSYQNPEVDKLLEEARAEFSEEKRAELYHRIHRLIYEDQPYAFLAAPQSLSLLHRRFQGVTEGKWGIGADFVRWFVPKGEHRYKIRFAYA